MNKKIKQFRFPNDPITFTGDWSDNLANDLGQITQLGIYALPGTKFKINQILSDSVEELIINGYGTFSIDVEDKPITSISLNRNSYNNANNNHFIIIDMVYVPKEVLGNE